MIAVSCRRMAVFSAVVCLAGLGSSAHADWTACQSKPSRACLLQEALGSGGAPLAGKDRLDVLIQGNATSQPGFVTAADIDEALRQAKSNIIGKAYPYAVLPSGASLPRTRSSRPSTWSLAFTEQSSISHSPS